MIGLWIRFFGVGFAVWNDHDVRMCISPRLLLCYSSMFYLVAVVIISKRTVIFL